MKYYVRYRCYTPVQYGVDVGYYLRGPFETEAAAEEAAKDLVSKKFQKQQSRRSAQITEVSVMPVKNDEIFFIGGAAYYE